MSSYFVSETEFVVNKYITLKLEDRKTILYVDGERFKQCMQLVLQIPLNTLEEYEHINSIDEAVRLNRTLIRLIQDKLEGKYEVVEAIAMGGTAVIFKIKNLNLQNFLIRLIQDKLEGKYEVVTLLMK